VTSEARMGRCYRIGSARASWAAGLSPSSRWTTTTGGLPRGEKQLMRSAALDVRHLINGPHGVALRLESDDEKGISLFGEATYVENRIIAYDATDVFAAPAPAAPTPRGTTLTTRWCMS
jgi:hypothetical protein